MNIILGHLIGDYLLQSDWMALNKKQKNIKGLFACIIHCLIWTISVYLFAFHNVTTYKLLAFILIFLSHFILDRSNFVKWYCNTTKIMPNPTIWKIILVDNTLHLLMLYILQLILLNWS